MSKEKELGADLEDAQDVIVAEEAKEKKEKKVQTPEEAQMLAAGVAKLRELGVSENLSKVLEIVSEWNGEKETISAKKAEMIESFGGSDKLKDYIDGDFKTDAEGFLGLAKVMPILNNIKSFYARREGAVSTKKVKTQQVNLGGTFYSVDSAFLATVQGDDSLDRDAKRQALLAHPSTVVAVIEEY